MVMQRLLTRQFTPPNWAEQKALYLITFPAQQNNQQVLPKDAAIRPALADDVPGPPTYSPNDPIVRTSATGPGFNVELQTSMFVFDAIRRAQHGNTANATQHPLQSGFNMSDHVVVQPNRLVLEVGMSDALASYNVPGYSPMWDNGSPSKSVNAFQIMKGLMLKRQIVTINTRLDTYRSMVLVSVESEDTARTYFGGLIMTLTFQQIIVADVAVQANSARVQVTGETKQGTVRTDQPSQTTIDQHQVKPIPDSKIPGAGIMQSPIISRAIETLARTGVALP